MRIRIISDKRRFYMKQTFYSNLTNQYSINKVLRFELKPIGATREQIRAKKLLETDENIAEAYAKIKKLIDEVHKQVIEETLSTKKLKNSTLEAYFTSIKDGNDGVETTEETLRKEVAAILSSHSTHKHLFSKELLTDVLPHIAKTQNDLDVIDVFARFSSFLTNYHEIRRNLYSAEEKHSTVAYRLIHENLPKHVENIKIFEKIGNGNYEISFIEEMTALEQYLGGIRLDDVFSILGFNDTLTQEGIDRYNQIIGGIATETTKLKGLNEVINLWNQTHPTEKLPKFMPLYKQMLSDSDTKSFVIDKFENDKQVYEALTKSFGELHKLAFTSVKDKLDEFNLMHGVAAPLTYESLFCDLNTYDKHGIYVKADNVAEISLLLFGKWNTIRTLISKDYDRTYAGKKKPGTTAYDTEKETALKKRKAYSVAELEDIIVNNDSEIHHADILAILRSNAIEKLSDCRIAERELAHALGSPSLKEKKLRKSDKAVVAIKNYLDSIKTLQNYLRLLQAEKSVFNKDERFYSDFVELWDKFLPFNSLYNKVRNYITSKPYANDKIKLNFGSPSLLNGWDLNKEDSNLGVLFHKDGNYYLGIMDKGNNKAFKGYATDETTDVYEKFDYKLLPGPNKMLPKVFFSAKGLEKYHPSEEILRIYKNGTFKKGTAFSLEDCHALINFFKDSIDAHEDWSKFGFKFSPTESYNDIGEFYKEVAEQGYMLTKRNVSAAYIDELVEKGQLYLFQIYSKDFSPFSKGNLDLQTIYWEMLFDERNFKGNAVYKLNGEAEIFYHKPSLNLGETAIHKKGSTLVSKNPLNPVKEKIAQWDIIKDKRYTEEKFLFHVGITLNFASKNVNNINYAVNEQIRNLDDYHVIGIKRGERNLICAVVINSRGEIVDSQQISLNTITNTFNNGKDLQRVDYRDLLDRKEKERDSEKKSWAPIEQIKDLKAGYLSQAIHVITQLAVKYNAFIAIEKLDTDFIRSRQKIEKQIYQNFEKSLITKLNFLVTDKNRSLDGVEIPGGALSAYQLTNPFVSFARLGIQNGILFRVPTYYVSNMDPTTGFTNFVYPMYETIEKSKAFFEKFESIRYNADKDYFEFDINFVNFTAKAEDTKEEWTVCTYGKRIVKYRNPENQKTWNAEEYYPTLKMKELLDAHNIYFEDGKCIKNAITEQTGAAFYKELMEILKMTLQMQNTGIINGEEVDFVQSCVLNHNDEFYNSLIAPETLPRSTDANGAYNVARKALMMIERIKESQDEDKIKMTVSNTEWLQYAQKES